MANADAFNSGFDAGMGGKSKKPKKPQDDINQKKGPKPVKEIHTSDGQTLYPTAMPKQFKKGGKVKRTGIAKVHAGEVVLTAKQAKKYGKKKASGHKCVAGKR
jgi:hypothetical protein